MRSCSAVQGGSQESTPSHWRLGARLWPGNSSFMSLRPPLSPSRYLLGLAPQTRQPALAALDQAKRQLGPGSSPHQGTPQTGWSLDPLDHRGRTGRKGWLWMALRETPLPSGRYSPSLVTRGDKSHSSSTRSRVNVKIKASYVTGSACFQKYN